MNRDWEGERRKKKKKEASSLSGYWLIRGFVFRWWTGICCKSIRDIELRYRGRNSEAQAMFNYLACVLCYFL